MFEEYRCSSPRCRNCRITPCSIAMGVGALCGAGCAAGFGGAFVPAGGICGSICGVVALDCYLEGRCCCPRQCHSPCCGNCQIDDGVIVAGRHILVSVFPPPDPVLSRMPPVGNPLWGPPVNPGADRVQFRAVPVQQEMNLLRTPEQQFPDQTYEDSGYGTSSASEYKSIAHLIWSED